MALIDNMISGSKGLSPHELAHRLVNDLATSPDMSIKVSIMCNLSTEIEERATEKTNEKFILNMYKKGYTLDQIADVAEASVDEVEAIIKKKEPSMA